MFEHGIEHNQHFAHGRDQRHLFGGLGLIPNPPERMSVAACERGKKVLLCFGDNGLRDSKPTRNKERPTDATT